MDGNCEQWIGYCAFHLGDYKRAMSIFEKLSMNNGVPPDDVMVNLACCQFYLGLYPESEEVEKLLYLCYLLHLFKNSV